jgi:hypothetical protein
MGATGWKYFVPYEPDISAALQRLKQDVFARGEYVFGHGLPQKDFDSRVKRLLPVYEARMKENFAKADDSSQSDMVRVAARHAAEHMKKELEKFRTSERKPSGKKPKTIAELLKQQAENGTHSILDITSVSSAEEFGAVSPLPKTKLVEVFGTETPSRAQIDELYESGSLEELASERWQGVYIVAYRDGSPSEIAFIGCSGD